MAPAQRSIGQNCGEALRKLLLAHAWGNPLLDVPISPYFSLQGPDLATDQTAEYLSPHFCRIPCTEAEIATLLWTIHREVADLAQAKKVAFMKAAAQAPAH